jgi:hypothetical protein
VPASISLLSGAAACAVGIPRVKRPRLAGNAFHAVRQELNDGGPIDAAIGTKQSRRDAPSHCGVRLGQTESRRSRNLRV